MRKLDIDTPCGQMQQLNFAIDSFPLASHSVNTSHNLTRDEEFLVTQTEYELLEKLKFSCFEEFATVQGLDT